MKNYDHISNGAVTGVAKMILRPQKGPQEQFLATKADIAIYGGAAGGGKTYALLLEPLRHMNVEGYSATIFRKNATQISIDGGLLDESMQIYGLLRNAVYKASPKPHWTFGGKAKVSFMHIDGDRDLPKWQGSQICFIGFDELCHFSEMQFFYMLSRNRSTCGIKPYVRATCNPDVDSWVAKFVSWWIDQETGYPIPERSGVLRYFCRENAEVKWGDSPEELSKKYDVEPELCKSVTFIASSIYDNKILLERDPSYLANLHGLSLVERERLLKGNWKIKPVLGNLFKTSMFQRYGIENGCFRVADKIYEASACKIFQTCDVAGSRKTSADYFVLGTFAICPNGELLILEILRERLEGPDQPTLITRKHHEYKPLMIGVESVNMGLTLYQELRRKGLPVIELRPDADKYTRAIPAAARYEAGMVYHLENATWLIDLEAELLSFPNGAHDDQVDVISYAVYMQSWGYLGNKKKKSRALVFG